MTKLTYGVLIIIVGVTASFGQQGQPQYPGQKARAIKSLSEEEVQGFLQGDGLGFAKAAELNHYPGPKHVLELCDSLALTVVQIEQTRKLFTEMQERAVALGEAIVEKERDLNRLFAQKMADPSILATMVLELGRIRSSIRLAHLSAHLKMREVLSPAQVERYDILRGYSGASPFKVHHHD